MRTRKLVTALVAAAAAGAVAGGVAWATIPDSSGVIQGCYDSGGNVKVVAALPCPRGYTPFQWNQQGPPGIPGATGGTGPAGAKGDKGDPCLPSDPACVGPKGDKGDTGDQGPPGTAGGSAPVGTVVSYAGSAAPQGWLVADGSAVSRTAYSELFAAIGTTYGAGDGSTTFTLPDLRGRVVVAVGSNGDVSALGQNDGAAEPSRSPLHTHTVPAHSHGVGTLAVGVGGGGGYVPGSFTKVMRCTSITDSVCTIGSVAVGFINTLGGSGSFGSNPPNTPIAFSEHSHSLGGRVGDTAGVDGDQPMTSGAGGPSYIALTYIIRAS
jgi:microcystin-dependent protein